MYIHEFFIVDEVIDHFLSGLLPDGWVSVNNLVSGISEHLLTIHDAEISKSQEAEKCTSIKIVHQLDETVRDAQMEKFTQLIEENEVLKVKNKLKEEAVNNQWNGTRWGSIKTSELLKNRDAE